MAQTTTELATAFNTTPRTLRKFLRSADSGIESVGKGARYTLPTAKREVTALGKRFTAWSEAQQAKRDDATDAPAPVSLEKAPKAPLTDDDDAPSLDDIECPLDN